MTQQVDSICAVPPLFVLDVLFVNLSPISLLHHPPNSIVQCFSFFCFLSDAHLSKFKLVKLELPVVGDLKAWIHTHRKSGWPDSKIQRFQHVLQDHDREHPTRRTFKSPKPSPLVSRTLVSIASSRKLSAWYCAGRRRPAKHRGLDGAACLVAELTAPLR